MNKPTKLQQEMFAVIEDFQQSGLTRLAFCAQRGIAITKFQYWQKKYREHSNVTSNGFIRLTSRKSHRTGELLASIVLQYPNGVVSGNYKCRFSVNKNASKSASLISDLQRNKILKNDIFEDCFSVFQPVGFTG
jgi:hypothetical protein